MCTFFAGGNVKTIFLDFLKRYCLTSTKVLTGFIYILFTGSCVYMSIWYRQMGVYINVYIHYIDTMHIDCLYVYIHKFFKFHIQCIYTSYRQNYIDCLYVYIHKFSSFIYICIYTVYMSSVYVDSLKIVYILYI